MRQVVPLAQVVAGEGSTPTNGSRGGFTEGGMVDEHNRKGSLDRLLQIVACYALWIGLSALGSWAVLQFRHVLIVLAGRLGLGRWTITAADRGGVILLGIAWLGGIIWLEDYLRHSANEGHLWSQAARIFLYEVIALGLILLARTLLLI